MKSWVNELCDQWINGCMSALLKHEVWYWMMPAFMRYLSSQVSAELSHSWMHELTNEKMNSWTH